MVYVLAVPAKEAIAMSLLVVGVTSAVATATRAGNGAAILGGAGPACLRNARRRRLIEAITQHRLGAPACQRGGCTGPRSVRSRRAARVPHARSPEPRHPSARRLDPWQSRRRERRAHLARTTPRAESGRKGQAVFGASISTRSERWTAAWELLSARSPQPAANAIAPTRARPEA